MLFRRMEPRDRDSMRSFFDEMGEESTHFFNRNHGNEKRTMAFFEDGKPDHEFYVMEEEGTVIGYCFIWDFDRSVPWFGIAVRESWKGRHIGTEMLTRVLTDLEKRGYGGLLLTTGQKNYRGQALYEKCGFERLGIYLDDEFLYIRRFTKTGTEK